MFSKFLLSGEEQREIEQGLKPCPFCGNTEIAFSFIIPKQEAPTYGYWKVLCPKCGVSNSMHISFTLTSPEVWESGKKILIRQWNTRAPKNESEEHFIASLKEKILAKQQRYTLAHESAGCGQVEWSDYLIKVDELLDLIGE